MLYDLYRLMFSNYEIYKYNNNLKYSNSTLYYYKVDIETRLYFLTELRYIRLQPYTIYWWFDYYTLR